jgi:hypothetical protein
VVVVVSFPLCQGCGCQQLHAGSVADRSDRNVGSHSVGSSAPRDAAGACG